MKGFATVLQEGKRKDKVKEPCPYCGSTRGTRPTLKLYNTDNKNQFGSRCKDCGKVTP